MPPGARHAATSSDTVFFGPAGRSRPVTVNAEQITEEAKRALAAQREDVLHQLLVQSGVALAAIAHSSSWSHHHKVADRNPCAEYVKKARQ